MVAMYSNGTLYGNDIGRWESSFHAVHGKRRMLTKRLPESNEFMASFRSLPGVSVTMDMFQLYQKIRVPRVSKKPIETNKCFRFDQMIPIYLLFQICTDITVADMPSNTKNNCLSFHRNSVSLVCQLRTSYHALFT